MGQNISTTECFDMPNKEKTELSFSDAYHASTIFTDEEITQFLEDIMNPIFPISGIERKLAFIAEKLQKDISNIQWTSIEKKSFHKIKKDIFNTKLYPFKINGYKCILEARDKTNIKEILDKINKVLFSNTANIELIDKIRCFDNFYIINFVYNHNKKISTFKLGFNKKIIKGIKI